MKHGDVFDDLGSGPAIIFVHGFVSTRKVFGYQLVELSRDRRVIAIDMPGCGGTSWDPKVHWFDQAVERVVDVAEQAGVEQPLLVGWSLGGSVVTAAAARIPESRTVLVGSRLGKRPEETRERILASIMRDYPLYASKLIALMCHNVSAETQAWLLGHAINTPVLVAAKALMSQPHLDPVRIAASIVGGNEGVVEVEHVDPEVQAVTTTFENSGHLPFLEERDRFNELIRELSSEPVV